MSNQYQLANHTILPLIYRIIHPQTKSLSYLIKEPQTKSLFLFAHPKNNNLILNHLEHLELQTNASFRYTFLNEDLKFNKIKKQELITPSIQGDLKPLVIGDISVCFINAKGYSSTFSLIAVTHITSSSTKFPIILPGTLLNVCSIDYNNTEIAAQDYLKSLQKIKYFPNQTYIFPTNLTNKKDLTLAKELNQGNSLIDQKIQLYKKNQKYLDALIPTTIMEQKIMNPFLSPEKYINILNASDRFKAFNILRKMRTILDQTFHQ